MNHTSFSTKCLWVFRSINNKLVLWFNNHKTITENLQNVNRKTVDSNKSQQLIRIQGACGSRIAENIGALALESYRKRIAAPIAALDAEDKGFWDWAVARQIPVTKTTNSGRANHLLHSGVVAAVVGEIPTNYFKAQGFG
ncbi:hypothetical protein [Planktothrix agardhii]|jgi:hypothetical protein|uniref:hypothetical protein n=1 Tax=Planktothrix agardhii TaxID=1160 RepID=UPI0033404D3A